MTSDRFLHSRFIHISTPPIDDSDFFPFSSCTLRAPQVRTHVTALSATDLSLSIIIITKTSPPTHLHAYTYTHAHTSSQPHGLDFCFLLLSHTHTYNALSAHLFLSHLSVSTVSHAYPPFIPLVDSLPQSHRAASLGRKTLFRFVILTSESWVCALLTHGERLFSLSLFGYHITPPALAGALHIYRFSFADSHARVAPCSVPPPPPWKLYVICTIRIRIRIPACVCLLDGELCSYTPTLLEAS